MNLSDNFSLAEFTSSQTATRRGINNNPTVAHRLAMSALCNAILEPLRAHFGRPVRITSGYRSKALNDAIGGSQSSDHSKGMAADFEIAGVSNYRLAKWIEANLVYRQLILEFYKPGDENSGWVHCSFNPADNKKESLTAVKRIGKVIYLAGLVK